MTTNAGEHTRVLIVEDDPLSQRFITLQLEDLGYQVTVVGTGLGAIEGVQRSAFDVILLDIGLPDMDGVDVCRRLRELSNAAIIFVSGRADEFNKVMALDAGGDDYVTKPFTAAELAARMRAVLRRATPAPPPSRAGRIEAGGVVLDTAARTATVRGTEVTLTAREFDLLQLLMQQSHRVLRRSEILEVLWGADFVGDPNALDSYILHLRQKLECNPRRPRLIVTVHGVGYRFRGAELNP